MDELIHKQRRPENYYNDLKYHMTLNIILSVVMARTNTDLVIISFNKNI